MIILTPEILQRCGFEMPSMTKWINKDWILYKDLRDDKFYLQVEKQGSGEYICERIELPIKHLHQLQNLYFALTGEELEYKPEMAISERNDHNGPNKKS